MNEKDLTPHLINLLYEQKRTEDRFSQLRELGMTDDRGNFTVDILKTVLDIIGIPKDSSNKIATEHEDFFCRDSFFDEYYKIFLCESEAETKKMLSKLISDYYNFLRGGLR